MPRPIPTFLILLTLSFLSGIFMGYLYTGGSYKRIVENEIDQKELSQYLGPNDTIEDRLQSTFYTHCVTYPGVGLVFSGHNDKNHWVVDHIIGGSSLSKLETKIQKGDVVITPLEVIRGDLGSPLKIEYLKQGKGETLFVLVTRSLLNKCYLKKPRVKEDNNLQVY